MLSNVNSGENLARFDVRAFNDLYGGQLGLDVTLWNRGGPFRLETSGKAGVYANHARNRYSLTQTDEDPAVDSARKSKTAFAGEIGLTGVFQVSSRWSARFGYQVLWLDGVALAFRQTGALDPLHEIGPGWVIAKDTALFHGFTGALEFRW